MLDVRLERDVVLWMLALEDDERRCEFGFCVRADDAEFASSVCDL